MGQRLSIRLLRLWLLAGLAAFGLLSAPRAMAAGDPTEYEIKSVMLFNLARYVEWPATVFANTNSPIVIGILGRNPFGETLTKAVRGETVNGRKIVVEHYESPQALRPCHILFIAANEKPRVTTILAKLQGRSTLTVSEIDGFSKIPGGMVRFYTNPQNKIRLRLNLESAQAEGLHVSSQLIRVAELDKVSLFRPAFPQFEFRLAQVAPPALPLILAP